MSLPLYERAKKCFADKLAADFAGQGRFESAFFHTVKMVHDAVRAEAEAEHAARIAVLQADMKTLLAALKTANDKNAELRSQREDWLAICRSEPPRTFGIGDLRAMEEFIATTERKPA